MWFIFQSNARQIARRRLFQAQRALVSHGCQAEYHNAMAAMYADRVRRLQEVVGSDQIDSRITDEQMKVVRP